MRIEGILSRMDKRLNHIIETEIGGLRAELGSKADKWEIRIWFLIIVLLMTVYQFPRRIALRPGVWYKDPRKEMEEKAQGKESPTLEERLARVEGILEEVRARLNHLETEIGGLRGEINGLRQEMSREIGGLRGEINGLRQEMYTNFRWTLGVLIPMWVTIILAIVFTR